MILIGGLVVVAALGCCAAFTAVGVWLIERAHRPGGVFVPVSGGRLHVVELGPPPGGNDLPVVLLHGASGNTIVRANSSAITGVAAMSLYQEMPPGQEWVTGASSRRPATRSG